MLYDFLYEFSVVAQEKSLSTAARKLGISRATLGRHMDALEAQLEADLLRRDHDGVGLTKDGRYTLATAVEIANIGDAMRRGVGPAVSECLSVVGLTDCATPLGLLGKACDDLSTPNSHVNCAAQPPSPPSSAMRSVAQGKADIALVYSTQISPSAKNGAISSAPLCTVTAAVASDAVGGTREAILPAELTQHRFARQIGGHLDDGAWDELAFAAEARGILLRTAEMRYGLGAPTSSSISSVCAAEGATADVMRAAGKSVVPIKDLQLEIHAVWRTDNRIAAEVVTHAVAVGLSSRCPDVASRESIYASIPKENLPQGASAPLDPGARARLFFSKVLNEAPVTEDLVLPDGRVVDRAYVALRNRLNRLADGLSGTPTESSYDAIMHLWSVDEARAMLEMPMFGFFSDYDWAVSSGRDETACAALLDDLASRGLLYRVRRGGTPFYTLIPWAYGIWEFRIGQHDTDFLPLEIYGTERGTGSRYPIMHACPVAPEIVEGGKIAPYRDWQAHVRRQTKICVAPCQCRTAEKALDLTAGDDGHPEEVCFTFGEMAQYWIENGLGQEITQKECLERTWAAIKEHGLVPQLYYDKNPEVFCLCRSGCCLVLSALRATGGQAASMELISAYRLHYIEAACTGCGLCAQRCPMGAIGADGEKNSYAAGPTCIACGQCALACPAHARALALKPGELPALPADMLEGYRWRSADRMARGYISDFTEPRIATY